MIPLFFVYMTEYIMVSHSEVVFCVSWNASSPFLTQSTILASGNMASHRFSGHIDNCKRSVLSLCKLDLPGGSILVSVVWESVHCFIDNVVGYANATVSQLLPLLDDQRTSFLV